jgi:hypothetical protein
MRRDVPSAAELFRAAKLERAPESLRAALLAGPAPAMREPSPANSEPGHGRKRARRRSWAAGAFAAAAALTGVWWGSQRSDDSMPISAEQPLMRATPPASSDEPTAAIAPRSTGSSNDPLRNETPSNGSGGAVSGLAQRAATPMPVPKLMTSRKTRGPTASPPSPSAETAQLAAPARATFAEQLEVIRQARSALRAGDGEEALAVLDRHQAALRAGDLEAEARLLRVEALASSGRAPEARVLAQRFLADYPNSPLADRARALAQPLPRAP